MSWGIIGLGWLGLELFKTLENKGEPCWGTKRSDFQFGKDPFPRHPTAILFLNTPPLIELSPQTFVDEVRTEAKKIIFVSSTSVYGNQKGLCTEETPPSPQTKRAEWLVDVEMLLKERFNQRLLIIRPGGLIGEDRHPVYSIPKGRELEGGKDVVNLIHRKDLIEIIIRSSQLGLSGVLNAVSPEHPEKGEYYREMARKLELEEPLYKNSHKSPKEVSSLYTSHFFRDWTSLIS